MAAVTLSEQQGQRVSGFIQTVRISKDGWVQWSQSAEGNVDPV